MNACDRLEPGTVEQYYYGELDERAAGGVEDHLRTCAICRGHLDDLETLSSGLPPTAVVDAPAGGEWSGFMRRLDQETTTRVRRKGPYLKAVRWGLSIAAAVAIAVGAAIVQRRGTPAAIPHAEAPTRVSAAQRGDSSRRDAVQAIAAEHLERSKVVVLDLAMRDPHERSADWRDERRQAESLLSDTRLYRVAAEQNGLTDMARVLRDLETVLLETSMSDSRDPHALARVQRLIAKRDLLMKMQLVAADAPAAGTDH